MRIFALFNLKPGVAMADYLSWARQVDLPTVTALDSISSFEIFRTTGMLGSDAAPPYGFIEVLEVNDMDAFGRDVATEAMQQVAAAFGAMVDVTFLTTEQITP